MRPAKTLRLGSRGSDLALWQAHSIQGRLQTLHPDWEFPIEVIRTSGDRIQDRPLYRIEDKGFFTKEIEEALLTERCDLAVHSLKDLPTESPAGLLIAAIPPREDPHDVWVSRRGTGLAEAAPGAVVGTSSLRRQAQLKAVRPDLTYQDLRGNVPTRLRRLEEGAYDAVVMARAGLSRLGLLSAQAREIPFDQMLPAPGQGALAIQIRAADEPARACLLPLDDMPARLAVTAERTFLQRLQGGCLVPIGALAEVDGIRLRLRGLVADLTGSPIVRGEEEAPVGTTPEESARSLGVRLAERLLKEGAAPLLERVRRFLLESRGDCGEGPRV